MVRYWKLVGAVAAVAILAVVLVAAVPAANSGEVEPQLITLLDDVRVGLGGTDSAYVNVEGFSKFKGFVRWEGPQAPGDLQLEFVESMDGVVDVVNTEANVASHSFPTNTVPPADFSLRFQAVGIMPFRYLKARVSHTNVDDPQTVSVFLYAVP